MVSIRWSLSEYAYDRQTSKIHFLSFIYHLEVVKGYFSKVGALYLLSKASLKDSLLKERFRDMFWVFGPIIYFKTLNYF